MRFLTKKKCMKGGMINSKKTQVSNKEPQDKNTTHPDIGKPIPSLSLFAKLPKEFKAKTYGVIDLTQKEKQDKFNKIRKENPSTESKYLLSKFYESLKKEFLERQTKNFAKAKEGKEALQHKQTVKKLQNK